MGVIHVSKKLKVNSFKGSYEVEIINPKEEKKVRDMIFKELSQSSFLIIDENLINLFPFITQFWSKKNIYPVRASENSKTLRQSEKLIKKLIETGFKKNMKLIALGGGVIQDLTSFVASLIYRGVDWIFVPTTLLSQADSCIGSKTSINFQNTKNLLGTFNPPKKIFSFLSFLETLDSSEIKSGIGEILHYYIVDNSDLIKEIRDKFDDLLINRTLLQKHIEESLAIKKNMVEKDEFDKGPRAIFNYGHTFGHALEVISGFEVSHGQAVTRGMDLANYIALKYSMITIDSFREYRSVLEKNFPVYKLSIKEIKNFISLLRKDKKALSGEIICILPTLNKEMTIFSISDLNRLEKIIYDYLKNFW